MIVIKKSNDFQIRTVTGALNRSIEHVSDMLADKKASSAEIKTYIENDARILGLQREIEELERSSVVSSVILTGEDAISFNSAT